jgi:uncharacterized protein YjbJ (UPF0337 family)
MGWDDELGDMKNEAKGAVKDYVGMATGDADADVAPEGWADQSAGTLEQRTEKVRDASKKD